MQKTFGTYEHVCIIGCDGMGTFHRNTDTPNIDKLFEKGATNFTTLAAKPSISAQGWASVLTGAIPETHRLTNYDMHPIPELPTIFRLVKDAYPDAETAAYSAWSPIPLKIISPEGGMTSYAVGPDFEPEDRKNDNEFWIEVDEIICEKTLKYLSAHNPKLLFMHFGCTDTFGHRCGYGSSEQLRAIRRLDVCIEKIVDTYKEKGIFEKTLFIVTADHGGTWSAKNVGSHGGWTDEEKYVFLGVAGKNVAHGEIGKSCIRDIPAIVLHALGIQAPAFNRDGYAAQLPVGIFEDAGITDRVELYPQEESFACQNYEQPKKDSSEYIGNFLDENKIKFWQTFEDGIEDVTGNCNVVTQSGIIKRYNDGLLGKYGEFGNGVLQIKGIKVSERFTFSFWFKTSSNAIGLDLFSNKNGRDNGFSITLTSEFVNLFLKNPLGKSISSHWVFQPDGTVQVNPLNPSIKFSEMSERSQKDQWTHFMLSVDTTTDTVSTYVNFKPVHVYVCDALVYDRYGYKFAHSLSKFFNMDTVYMGFDKDEGALCKLVDDVMILDGTIDPKTLELYYKNLLKTEK